MLSKFFRVGAMLASAALAARSFWFAYLNTFRIGQVLSEVVADPTAVRPEAATLIALSAPLDFLTGVALIFWPFFLGWLEEKWRR